MLKGIFDPLWRHEHPSYLQTQMEFSLSNKQKWARANEEEMVTLHQTSAAPWKAL